MIFSLSGLSARVGRLHGHGSARLRPDWPDFGPGAAVHLSSGADPVQAWLKKMSHVERDPNTAIPELLKEVCSLLT